MMNPYGTFQSIRHISKYKTRLVARCFMQIYDIDYIELFALVARLEIVKLVVAITTNRNRSLYHLYVKFSFLNGPL